MSRFVDLTERKFGRLVVIKRVKNNQWEHPCWLCKCDCGNIKIISSCNLSNDKTKSCGCSRIKHGHTRKGQKTKTYQSWHDMIQRCTNHNDKKYNDYGNRGITICQRWMKFENFLKDMSDAPRGHQIDRIDNNKGYNKSNCHWVTSKQNNRNKRDNHLITYGGKTQCISAWSEELGIRIGTLYTRINRNGWSIEKALTTLTKGKKKNE